MKPTPEVHQSSRNRVAFREEEDPFQSQLDFEQDDLLGQIDKLEKGKGES